MAKVADYPFPNEVMCLWCGAMDVSPPRCEPDPERVNLIRELYSVTPPTPASDYRGHRWVRIAPDWTALDPRVDQLAALLDELGHTGPSVSTS